MRTIGGGIKRSRIPQDPVFPRSRIVGKELVNELHEHVSSLELFKIFDSMSLVVLGESGLTRPGGPSVYWT
jgi:hypothetical protein